MNENATAELDTAVTLRGGGDIYFSITVDGREVAKGVDVDDKGKFEVSCNYSASSQAEKSDV